MSTTEGFGVRLKRKVRSVETKLFEWRPCSCTVVARDGKLLLQLQTPPQDEESQDQSEEETELVTIDLATQFLNVMPKKNKARCDLEYYATMSEDVLKEQLMAPSASHCQQWIAQIRRVQQQVQQQRPTSSSSTRSEASPVAPLPSPLMNNSELAGSKDSSGISMTNETAAREPSPLRRQVSCVMSGSELAQREMTVSSPAHRSPLRPHSTSSSLSSSAISFTLPKSLAMATAASDQVRERCDGDQLAINSKLDHTIDSSSCSPAPVLEPAPRSDTRASLISSISSVSTVPPTSNWKRESGSSPIYSSSSESDTSRSPNRRVHQSKPSLHNERQFEVRENNNFGSDNENEAVRYRRRNLRRSYDVSEERHTATSRVCGVKLTSSSLSSRGSPSYRVSARTQQSPRWYNDLPRHSTAYEAENESSQAELHILQRVEAALRALELENAQAKVRERELVQEIQTQRDAARVAAAERKHIEQEYRHARREVDSWRRAAQSAEAAAAQLQEQLGIAREENQLLTGEKLRLKRQNNELLTQVHRLDSLVYGRF